MEILGIGIRKLGGRRVPNKGLSSGTGLHAFMGGLKKLREKIFCLKFLKININFTILEKTIACGSELL